MTPDELLAVAAPTIAATGPSFYFTPETSAAGAAIGLDPLQFYVLGRAGVLGDVEASVARSAIGYFNPTMIERAWDAGRARCAPRVAAQAHLDAAAAHGRAHLSAVEGLDDLVEAADAVRRAADPTALMLYAPLQLMPLADDAPGRAMQLIVVLRELRGSAHLVALRAVGLDDRVAHVTKRPDAVKLFGWRPEEVPAGGPEVEAQLGEAEVLTDRIVRPAFAVLDEDAAARFAAGLERVAAALG